MPVDHYENFPVASILLPKKLVPAVEAIYAFARSADDLADEGDALPAQRLAALGAYEAALASIGRGEPQLDPMFERLARVIAQYALPLQPFYDLLSAFKQDVGTSTYATFDLLLDYCARSANPVGFLMLSLYGAADARNVADSNAICSALQLINFLQDVAIDREKQRIYMPLDDLARYGVTAQQLDRAEAGQPFQALMAFEVARARADAVRRAAGQATAGAHRLGVAPGGPGRAAHPGAHRAGRFRRFPAPPATETGRLGGNSVARVAHVNEKAAGLPLCHCAAL
jgi:squalene synthase HpnC